MRPPVATSTPLPVSSRRRRCRRTTADARPRSTGGSRASTRRCSSGSRRWPSWPAGSTSSTGGRTRPIRWRTSPSARRSSGAPMTARRRSRRRGRCSGRSWSGAARRTPSRMRPSPSRRRSRGVAGEAWRSSSWGRPTCSAGTWTRPTRRSGTPSAAAPAVGGASPIVVAKAILHRDRERRLEGGGGTRPGEPRRSSRVPTWTSSSRRSSCTRSGRGSPSIAATSPVGGKTSFAPRWCARWRLTRRRRYSVAALLELARAYLAASDVAGARSVVREAEAIVHRRPALGVLVTELAEIRRQTRRCRLHPGRIIVAHRRRAAAAADPAHLPVVPGDRRRPVRSRGTR